MKIINFKQSFTVLIIFYISFPIFISSINNSNYNNLTITFIDDNSLNVKDSESVKSSSIIYTQDKVTGIIDNRNGKIFSNITFITSGAYINRYQPDLSEQPELYIPDWNLTYAKMSFENLTAVNYTYVLETNPSEFISCSPNGPIYIFQKFFVEVSQFINNVSIFIQDIHDPQQNPTEEDFWEIAIVNCLNDSLGSPNSNESEILGAVEKPPPPPPNEYAAHWEVFDFNNSDNGPVFLNVSKTNKTHENGIDKYWFALRIKIPPDSTMNYPKLLYFNPDGGTVYNKGEGDTFAISPDFVFDNYSINHVIENKTVNGTWINGNLNSFRNGIDEDRYFVNCTNDNLRFLNISTKFSLKNLTQSPLTYGQLLWLLIRNQKIDGIPFRDTWFSYHYLYIYSIDLFIATNVSAPENIKNATLFVYSRTTNVWENISRYFNNFTDIKQKNETLSQYRIRDPYGKYLFLTYLNNPFVPYSQANNNPNNTLLFKWEYYGNNNYNVSINQFTIEIGELMPLTSIQAYDPVIQRLHQVNSLNIDNGTTTPFGSQNIDLLKQNDNKYYRSQANTTNITIEFKLHVLTDLSSSLWNNINYYDWISTYPNPIIPIIDIRTSTNVSIRHPYNITLASLEYYKGNLTFDFLSPEDNNKTWITIGNNRTFAFTNETTLILQLGAGDTWAFLQIINQSDNNAIRLRFKYATNCTSGTPEWGFNLTIDEFSINFYIQNVISSDIASRVGFGINSKTLKPSDIEMKINENRIIDNGYQKGNWEGNVGEGVPFQGYYKFNVTSLWPEINFDINGTYEIEKYISFQWEFELNNSADKIIWYIGQEISYYERENYTIIGSSRGLQVSVPADWLYMNTYNFTTPSHGVSGGGWHWINETIGLLKFITLYNISNGMWKVKMNSSIYSMDISYSDITGVMIDNTIFIDALIPNHYGGSIFFEVHDSDNHLIYEDSIILNKTAKENSTSFSWDIFATTHAADRYSLTTYWTDYNQTHAFVSLEIIGIKVSKYTTVLNLMGIETFKNESIIGTNILISGNLTTKNPGESIEGETVIFEISSVGGIIGNLTDITNEEGIVQVEYTLPEGYDWIKIKLIYNSTGTFYEETESTKVIKITLISQLQSYINIFLLFLPYILAVAGGISALVVYRQLRLRKLREFWSGEALILDDLLKISYIMIIHKDVGVTIYNNQISMQLDSDLIGGFLTAISQFRSEIKKPEKQQVEKKKILEEKQQVEGKQIGEEKQVVEEKDVVERKELLIPKGFEMDYYDFKIVITDGNYVRVALILEGAPSEKLKVNQWAFTNEFEDKFFLILKKFTGDVKPFKETDQLVEKYFSISLMYPLQVGKHWEVIQLNTLEKALMEVAEQVQKEKKFLFVSNLLSFGLAGRKESRDQIISTILTLKRKGLLVPLETK